MKRTIILAAGLWGTLCPALTGNASIRDTSIRKGNSTHEVRRQATERTVTSHTSRGRKKSEIERIIAQSKYPKTLRAIAQVESNFDQHAVGDNGKSYGLFQIQRRHWGPVPKSVHGQVRKAEEVFGHLVEKHGYSKAIERWNGNGREARNYRRKVLMAMEG